MKTHSLKLLLSLSMLFLLQHYAAAQNPTCSAALNIPNGAIKAISSHKVWNWTQFTASETSHEVVLWETQDSIPQDLDSVFVYSGSCSGQTLLLGIDIPTADAAVFTLSGLNIGSNYFIVAKREPQPGCGSCDLVTKGVSFFIRTSATSCTDMVYNGSFEIYDALPYCGGTAPQYNGNQFAFHSIEKSRGWTSQYASIYAYTYNNGQDPNCDFSQPNYSTSSDYLHTTTGNIGCINFIPSPRTGNAHGGMTFTSDQVNGLGYKEMIISDTGTIVPVVAGRSYTLTYYVKRKTGNTSCTFGAFGTGQLTQSVVGAGTQYTGYITPAANGWTRVDCFITAGWTGAFQFGIIFTSAALAPNQDNYFYVEDVSMYETIALYPSSGVSVCAGSAANMTFYANGGTTPPGYTWSISPAVTIVPNGNSCLVPSLPTAGTYTLSVSGTTFMGCPSTASVILTAMPSPSVSVTPSSVFVCTGSGSAILTATPNTSPNTGPYTYQWYNQFSPIAGATTNSYNAPSSGTYHVDITNNYGCIATSNNVTVTYYTGVQVGIMASTDESCDGSADGSALAGTMAGTAPYTYSWNTSPPQTTNLVTGLAGGTYTVTVTDANGCTGTAVATVNTNPAPPVPTITTDATSPNLCNDQKIVYTITNYDPQWNYTPSFNISPDSWGVTGLGVYTVDWGQSCDDVIFTVTVDNGTGNALCEASASIEVDGCCGACNLGVTDALMSGVLGSKTVIDLYNYYAPAGFVTQVGNNVYYNNPNGTLYINGDFLVPNNINFHIVSSEVRFGSDAAIYLMGSATMTIDNSHLAAGCDDMWDGIYIPVNATLYSQSNSLIEDAKHAVVSIAGGTYQLTETIFNKNRIGVDVLNYSGAHPGTITNCVFTCRDLSAGANLNSTKGNQNTSPFIQVYPVVSYPVTGMLSPYAGIRSYAGVYVNSNGSASIGSNFEVTSFSGLTIGDVNGGYSALNVFDNMDYGINAHYSNIVVDNNAFQYITGPTSVNKGGQAYGIAIYGYTFSEQDSYWIAHVGGTNSGQRNTFFECGRGVDLNGYYDVEIIDNLFECRQTYAAVPSTALQTTGNFAAFVKSGYYREIEINQNNIVDWNTGVAFYADYLPASPGQHYKFMGDAFINDNRISPLEPTASNLTVQYVRTAIVTQNIIPPCSNCLQQSQIGRLYVERNDIDNVFNGIVVQQWIKRPRIADNNIFLRYQTPLPTLPFAQTGIRLIKDNTAVVYRNTIIGDAQAITKANVRGIYATQNTNSPIWCNYMQNVGQCMVYEGNCLGSQIFNNEMFDAQDGFVLLNNGKVGPQGGYPSPLNPNGQTCDNYWYGPFSHAATYTDQTYTPAQHSPLFVRDVTLNPAYVPVVNLTTGITQIDDYDASNALNIVYTPAPSVDCGQPPAIVENNPFSDKDKTQWVMEKIAGDSLEYTGDVEAVAWAAKKSTYELLSQDSTLREGSVILQDFYIEAEVTSVGQTVVVAELLGSNEFTTGETTNSSIAPELTLDYNEQVVNAIYVDIMEGSAPSDSQWTQLETIATLCPMQGGEGVYRARTLLALLNDNYVVYEDTCTTTQGNQRRALRYVDSNSPMDRYTVYPNPTSGYLNIQYSNNSQQPVYFQVYDITGRIIQEVLLPPTVQLYVVDLSQLSNGMYQYTIGDKTSIYQTDKITITK